MISLHRAAHPATAAGGHSRRWLALRPLPAVAVCAAAALAAAGCGSSGSGAGGSGGTPASPAGGHPMSASQALSLAASQAQKVSSFTATMDISSSGTFSSHMTGSLAEQVKPTVLAHQKFTVSSNGTSIPGGMETLLTSNAIYMKMSMLTRLVGKPWVKLSFTSLKGTMGVSLAPLIHQLQGNNPLAQTQMLPAARNVRQVGTGTVDGVPVTKYSGTINVSAAMAKLDPGLKKLVGPAMAATGITTSHFTAWIDGQHLIRKLVETETGPSYHVTTDMVITSVNQPVNITVPPASQVASMPGM
jgi:hypothetical protein